MAELQGLEAMMEHNVEHGRIGGNGGPVFKIITAETCPPETIYLLNDRLLEAQARLRHGMNRDLFGESSPMPSSYNPHSQKTPLELAARFIWTFRNWFCEKVLRYQCDCQECQWERDEREDD